MNAHDLVQRLREVSQQPLPTPGSGRTSERHLALMNIAREDVSLARLAEAHFDALAILSEAGREPEPNTLYGVWAAELPGQSLVMSGGDANSTLSGSKMFCSGAGLIDRALVTVDPPEPWLIDVDLRANASSLSIDTSVWKAHAFRETNTAAVTFASVPISRENIICDRGWYLDRPGFWHGACGPASCWAGGALGLLDYARKQARSDPHTLAHRGAIEAAAWTMRAILETAGREIDDAPSDVTTAQARALSVRHSIERLCAGILEHFGRAYGPHPLAFVEETSRRCEELTIYLRQCHAERDAAALGALPTQNA